MVKIAIISDIHANAYAIKALMQDEKFNNCNNYYCCGDMLGYYYSFKETLEFINTYNMECIQGNHDNYLLNNINQGIFPDSSFEKKYGKALTLTQKMISKTDIDFIKAMPLQREIKLPLGKKGLLCHGSPFDTNEYIYPDIPDKELDKIFDLKYDFIFMGHSHYPVIFRRNQQYIINPGSVGQPRDRGGHASWAEISFDNNSIKINHINTKYDVSSLVNEIQISDKETPYLHQVLLR